MQEWRFNVLGRQKYPMVSFMNPVERAIFRRLHINNWPIADGLLVASFLQPKMIVKKEGFRNITIEMEGVNTRGQVAIDHFNKDKPNVRIIEEVNMEEFKRYLLWAVAN